eukprot:3449845-Rhodomonas_salina.1
MLLLVTHHTRSQYQVADSRNRERIRHLTLCQYWAPCGKGVGDTTIRYLSTGQLVAAVKIHDTIIRDVSTRRRAARA